jgi:hypothetical protein
VLILPDSMLQTPFFFPESKENPMTSFFVAGGPFMYLILILGTTAVILSVIRAVGLLRGNDATADGKINTILYLGLAALLLGITAQLTGLYSAAQVILRATAISPAIIAEGVLVSFNTTLFALYVLCISWALWLGLRALGFARRRRAL